MPEFTEEKFVKVPKADWIQDEYGCMLVKVRFCHTVCRATCEKTDSKPANNSEPKKHTKAPLLPNDWDWAFDDKNRRVWRCQNPIPGQKAV